MSAAGGFDKREYDRAYRQANRDRLAAQRRIRHTARRAYWIERLKAWGAVDSQNHGPSQPDFRARYPGYPFKSYVWNELVREAGYEPRLPGNHGKRSAPPKRNKRLANRQMVTGKGWPRG